MGLRKPTSDEANIFTRVTGGTIHTSDSNVKQLDPSKDPTMPEYYSNNALLANSNGEELLIMDVNSQKQLESYFGNRKIYNSITGKFGNISSVMNNVRTFLSKNSLIISKNSTIVNMVIGSAIVITSMYGLHQHLDNVMNEATYSSMEKELSSMGINQYNMFDTLSVKKVLGAESSISYSTAETYHNLLTLSKLKETNPELYKNFNTALTNGIFVYKNGNAVEKEVSDKVLERYADLIKLEDVRLEDLSKLNSSQINEVEKTYDMNLY